MMRSTEPIIMGFPLKGEWLTPNTPGTKIPSHGTDKLGTRYAYDFIKVDWNRRGYPAYSASLLKYILIGVSLNQYYCWGQEVYSPCDGIIIEAKDGYKEQLRTNLFFDIFKAYKNAKYFDPRRDNIQSVAGNYIIIKYCDDVYVGLVHLQTDSITVTTGQTVKKGECLGRVGHSGNSFMPHLHFQLMDSCDMATANGLPCAFSEYEIYQNAEWKKVYNSIPTNRDRIRF